MKLRTSKCPSVIPYYGGKYELSKKLIPLLPSHKRYFEPFFGGGSMYFRKPKADWNILNDIDNDLVNLYICVATEFTELTKYIYWFIRSRSMYEDFCDFIKNSDEISIPDPLRAAQYFYVIRNAFNNIPYNSFSKDTYWHTKMVEELKFSREKLNGATIENLDFRKLIPRYDIREGDFLYLDPPYVVADKKKYYRNNFTEELHTEMKELMDYVNTNDGQFMISYDDIPFLRELYKDYHVSTIDTKYLGSNPDVRGDIKPELLITNYKIEKNQTELF